MDYASIPLNEWPGRRHAKFRISRELVDPLARTVIAANPEIRSSITRTVSCVASIDCSVREEKKSGRKVQRHGVRAGPFNKEFRKCLREQGGWNFEVAVRDGILVSEEIAGVRIGGFDFARFDVDANLARFRNLVFGRRKLHTGPDLWKKALDSNVEWKERAARLFENSTDGEDAVLGPVSPTVVGELQLGNWALLHRDILKIASARRQVPIDLLFYVAPDGTFSSLISQGTVSYEGTLEAVADFRAEIGVPVWVVGVDIVEIGA